MECEALLLVGIKLNLVSDIPHNLTIRNIRIRSTRAPKL
jgi:hypothetical protein